MRGNRSDDDRGWSREQREARSDRQRERRPERREPGGDPGRYESAGDAGDRGWAEPWERDVTMRREGPDWRDQERSVEVERHASQHGGGYYDRLHHGGEERVPPGGWERPGYGMDDRGMEPREWRGPGEMPGYRDARERQRARAFSQNAASGGQVPSEFREWGRSGDRGERRILGEQRPQGDYPMREAWRRGPAGPGPDADRGPDGRRRSLEGGGRTGERGPHAGRGPKNYRRADDRIQEEICDRLMAHPRIDATDIEVEVREGKVVLRGVVPDRGTKHRAEDLVEGVLGVGEVDNQLRVQRGDRPAAGEPTREESDSSRDRSQH